MCWKSLETKCKEDYQIVLERGINNTHRKFIIAVISEELPLQPRIRIAAIVDRCLQQEPQPITTHTMLALLKYYLR